MQKANRIGNEIKNFNGQEVRTVWSEEDLKWYFYIVDVCRILTNQPDYNTARKYWNKLKKSVLQRKDMSRLQIVTN